MTKESIHNLIETQQPNICQVTAYKNNELVYSDCWNGYLWWIISRKKGIYAAIGNSGNVIYINPERKIVVAVASYFKPTIFDRVDFIQREIEPRL